MFAPVTGFLFRAHITCSRSAFVQVIEVNRVRSRAAITLNDDTPQAASRPVRVVDHGKLTKPVAKLWDRMFASETSCCACVHVSLVKIK
jgi:hypothetical protein